MSNHRATPGKRQKGKEQVHTPNKPIKVPASPMPCGAHPYFVWLSQNQVDYSLEFAEIVERNFWDLLL